MLRSASATSAAGAKAISFYFKCWWLLNFRGCIWDSLTCQLTHHDARLQIQVCEVAFGTVDASGVRQCSKEIAVLFSGLRGI